MGYFFAAVSRQLHLQMDGFQNVNVRYRGVSFICPYVKCDALLYIHIYVPGWKEWGLSLVRWLPSLQTSCLDATQKNAFLAQTPDEGKRVCWASITWAQK